jgi:AhpD family alkylhydroperoxidase
MPLTISTAPDSSKPILAEIQKSKGSIPNLMATSANSPTALQGYYALDAAWDRESFSARERQIILFAASVENRCSCCTVAHSTGLRAALRTPAELVFAIQHNIPVPNAKFNAVVTLVRELVRGRGHARRETVQNLIVSGYRKEQVMELLVGIALKTIGNYLDHLSPIPWIKDSRRKAINQSTIREGDFPLGRPYGFQPVLSFRKSLLSLGGFSANWSSQQTSGLQQQSSRFELGRGDRCSSSKPRMARLGDDNHDSPVATNQNH